jgi:hypothetical protein
VAAVQRNFNGVDFKAVINCGLNLSQIVWHHMHVVVPFLALRPINLEVVPIDRGSETAEIVLLILANYV